MVAPASGGRDRTGGSIAPAASEPEPHASRAGGADRCGARRASGVGARKIMHSLKREGISPPAASTVHAILQRHERIDATRVGRGWYQRFERPAPNQLWQMDFKGWHELTNGVRCHPLTVVDDHSRYLLCLEACADQTMHDGAGAAGEGIPLLRAAGADVRGQRLALGRRPGGAMDAVRRMAVEAGCGVIHSRPYHPQSRGKNERLHRTLKAEVLSLQRLRRPGAGAASVRCVA